MDYKKLIKTPEMRQNILRTLNFIPDDIMLKIQYYIKLGRRLKLRKPERFTEKLQWYKMYYRDPQMSQCVDKYQVREYVKSCNLEDSLVKCYGVFNSVEEVDFETLPNRFVLKKTNGGGGLNVLLCRDKETFDIEAAKATMLQWIQDSREEPGGREWAYKGIPTRIVAEEYLENEENPEAGISDYKFFCFDGEPVGLVVDVDRYTGHKRNFYDINWNYQDISSDCPNFGDHLPKPDGYEDMVEATRMLSKGFPFVRVDLYLIKGRVYFGELTFYPWSGYVQFSPDSFDYDMGKHFVLPEKKI